MRRPHDEDPSPRQGLQLAPYHRPTDACRPPGIPSTSRSTSRRQCLRGGTVRRCSPRRVVLPARCGFSPPPSTADESGAECPSALVLPALCPARISVSSSLLTATMNQKSSLREVPQFVSWVLTGNNYTNAKCRPRSPMSEFGGEAENIYEAPGDRQGVESASLLR